MPSQFQHLDPENDWSAPYRAWNLTHCPVRSRLRLLSWARHYGLCYVMTPEGEQFAEILRHFYDGWLGAVQILLRDNRKEIPDRILTLAAMRRRRLDRLFVQTFAVDLHVTPWLHIPDEQRKIWAAKNDRVGGVFSLVWSLGDGSYRAIPLCTNVIVESNAWRYRWLLSPSTVA